MRNSDSKLLRQRGIEARDGMYRMPSKSEIRVLTRRDREEILTGTRTWLDRVIVEEHDTFAAREDYPIRAWLAELSRSCWRALVDSSRTIRELLEAIARTALEYNACIGFWKRDADEESLDWWSDTDIAFALSFCGDEFPREHLRGEEPYSWEHVYWISTLVAIDYAVQEIEANDPYKAAAWTYRACEFRRIARSYRRLAA
jgi:hypothetical protein